MSLRNSWSVRLDIYNALRNTARDPFDTNVLNSSRREHIYLAAQQVFQIVNEIHKAKSNRTLKLDDQINITGIGCLSFGVGAKQTNLANTKLGSKIRMILLEYLDDLLSSQHDCLCSSIPEDGGG